MSQRLKFQLRSIQGDQTLVRVNWTKPDGKMLLSCWCIADMTTAAIQQESIGLWVWQLLWEHMIPLQKPVGVYPATVRDPNGNFYCATINPDINFPLQLRLIIPAALTGCKTPMAPSFSCSYLCASLTDLPSHGCGVKMGFWPSFHNCKVILF